MSTTSLDSYSATDNSGLKDNLTKRPNYLWLLPVIGAFAVIVYLNVKVLVPTAKDPGSNLYSTALGYPAQQRRSGEPIEVTTTRVVEESFSDSVAATGETVGMIDVEMRPQLTAVVAKVLVEEGKRVKKGDPLVQLDTAPAKDRLDRAKADLAIAELQNQFGPGIDASKKEELEGTLNRTATLLKISEERLSRYSGLKDQKAASSEEFALAEELHATRLGDYSTAKQQLKQHELITEQNVKHIEQTLTIKKAAVNEAERDLANSTMLAPCDGLVTHVETQVGELAVPNMVLLNLADDVVFEAYVDQTATDVIKPGDSATVRLVAYPGEQFQGKVVRVNPNIDTKGRTTERGRTDTRFTYSAWIKLDKDLPPGLQGHAEFNKDGTKTAVPDAAVIHLSAGEGMVMVLRDDRASILQVELGRTRRDLREIKSGLKAGDQVVLNPRGLEAGDQLQIANSGKYDQQTSKRPQLRNRSGS